MAANPKIVAKVQEHKAQILADHLYNNWLYFFEEDDSSAEVQEMLRTLTTDETVVERALDLITKKFELFDKKGETMNEDPGHQEAEEIYQQQEDEYYAGLADSES